MSPTVSPTINLDVASLPTIQFSLLEKRDPAEMKKLLDVCTVQGSFYLNFKNSEKTGQLLQDKNDVLRAMKVYFEQPLEVKMHDHRGLKTRGFMPVGTFTGVNDGSHDCFEHYALPREELYNRTLDVPEALQGDEALFKRYLESCDYATTTMLSCLSDIFGVTKSDNRFEAHHRSEKPSDTILATLSYPPGGTTHNKHTDIGSLTILFSDQWGLQLVDPSTGRWQFVEPRQDEAVINVGDALHFLTGAKLNSCLHRVLPPGGDMPLVHRYSLAYLLRPENDLVYRDTDGKKITAKEWHDKKYEIYAASHDEQAKNAILTGGMEDILKTEIAV